jgi:hypothetical protein
MEWLTNSGSTSSSMQVDIGYMPRMELRSAAPSVNMSETGITSEQLLSTMNDVLYQQLLNSFPWTTDTFMNEQDTLSLLERTFYPFKEVKHFE